MKSSRLLVGATLVGLAACGSGGGPTRAVTSIPPVPPEIPSASPSATASLSVTSSPIASTSSAPASPPASADASYAPVTLKTTEQKSTYAPLLLDIDTVTVTGVEGVPEVTAAAITSALDSAAAKAVTAVKGEDEKPTGLDQPHNSVTNTVLVAESDDRYVTVALTSDIYGSGAAHPNASSQFFTFLRTSGEPVSVSDLAGSGGSSALYARLQTQTRLLLPTVVGTEEADSIAMGTTARELANAHLYPRTDGLAVQFEAYQVASYAQGDVYIVVPWSALSGVVAADAIPTSAAPAPEMRGGSAAEFDDADVSTAISANTEDALKGIGSFTLVDPTYVQPPNGKTGFLLVQVVPDANPGQDVTVALKIDETAATPTYTVTNAAHGSAICVTLDTSVAAMAAIAC